MTLTNAASWPPGIFGTGMFRDVWRELRVPRVCWRADVLEILRLSLMGRPVAGGAGSGAPCGTQPTELAAYHEAYACKNWDHPGSSGYPLSVPDAAGQRFSTTMRAAIGRVRDQKARVAMLRKSFEMDASCASAKRDPDLVSVASCCESDEHRWESARKVEAPLTRIFASVGIGASVCVGPGRDFVSFQVATRVVRFACLDERHARARWRPQGPASLTCMLALESVDCLWVRKSRSVAELRRRGKLRLLSAILSPHRRTMPSMRGLGIRFRGCRPGLNIRRHSSRRHTGAYRRATFGYCWMRSCGASKCLLAGAILASASAAHELGFLDDPENSFPVAVLYPGKLIGCRGIFSQALNTRARCRTRVCLTSGIAFIQEMNQPATWQPGLASMVVATPGAGTILRDAANVGMAGKACEPEIIEVFRTHFGRVNDQWCAAHGFQRGRCGIDR